MTAAVGRKQAWSCRAAGLLAVALACLGSLASPAVHAAPAGLAQPPEQGLLCRAAIRAAERGRTLPPYLLNAIGRVETGRSDPVTGRVHPWPWSINAEGRDLIFDSKAEAVAGARQLLARGVKSFDVGCMQVNMMYHPDAFRDLDEAFDPLANARYAADFLTTLKDQTGNWQDASAGYHSLNPDLGRPYRAKVEQALVAEARDAGDFASLPALASAGDAVGTPMISALRSLPGHALNNMIFNAHTTGAILPLPVTSSGGMVASGTSGGPVLLGRGLDAYRARPVAILTNRAMLIR